MGKNPYKEITATSVLMGREGIVACSNGSNDVIKGLISYMRLFDTELGEDGVVTRIDYIVKFTIGRRQVADSFVSQIKKGLMAKTKDITSSFNKTTWLKEKFKSSQDFLDAINFNNTDIKESIGAITLLSIAVE